MNHLVEVSIPPLYKKWDILDMVGPQNIQEISEKINQYIANPEVEKEGHNLYIYSKANGSGKTSLAYYILNKINAPRLKEVNGYQRMDMTPIVAVKFANYLKFCVDTFGQDSKEAKRQVETAPFLLLDDVSTWALSPTPRKENLEFILLMMYRREHLLPTIITSNLIPTEFEKTFGTTVASKVLEDFSYIEVDGGDVRNLFYPNMFEENSGNKA